jgi:hypothetical protein
MNKVIINGKNGRIQYFSHHISEFHDYTTNALSPIDKACDTVVHIKNTYI